MSDRKRQLQQDGFAIVPDVLSADCCDQMCRLVEQAIAQDRNGCVSNSNSTFGLRNLTDAIPEVCELLQVKPLQQLIQEIVGEDAFLVRATLFDKTDQANWGVFWHQDLAIAVQDRHEVEGFGGWTRKAGVVCCQPPSDVMNRILAVRLHLDDCTADNGALKVLKGSHCHGRIAETNMDQVQIGLEEVVCEVSQGGAVLMNPLTLHASGQKNVSGHRRVIHLEFTNQELPQALQWKYRIPLMPHSGSVGS